jgi:glycosyltransferase involved in cell wall biosynthesis
VRLRASAVAVAPLAMLAGWFKALRVAQKKRATIVHAHWVIPGGVIGAAAAGSIPLIVSLHGSDVFVAEKHPVARFAARTAFGRATWVTACSEDLRTRAVALGADATRSTVIPYGVDSEQFRPDAGLRARGRAYLGVADEAPLVVAIGRLVTKKGFEYLIDAAAVLTTRQARLRVAIAGEGDLAPSLRTRAQAAGLGEAVQFLGAVPHDVVPALLAAADVAVAPAIGQESFGIVLIEAMAAGAPVVASDIEGYREVVGDRASGLLVPPGDAEALARALGSVLGDPALAARLADGGRTRAAAFDWATITPRLEGLYAAAIGGAGPAQR